MKNIRTFDQFVNESINEGKYDDTFIPEIEMAKRSKNPNELRRVAKDVDGGYDGKIDKMTDKEVKKYLNDYVKSIKDEYKNKAIFDKIEKELERLLKNQGIEVRAHAGVPEDKLIKFTRPIFTTYRDPKAALEFLKDSNYIEVFASPTVVNKWDVEYSGTVKNNTGDTLEFSGVDNGLAVMHG